MPPAAPDPALPPASAQPPRRPIKVALLAPTLAPAGGLCRWSRETVRALEMVTTPDQLSIDVLCRSSAETAQRTIEQFGLRCGVHDIWVGTNSPRDALRSIQQVGTQLAELKPDVVYTPLDWLWLLADRRRNRPRIIATAHGETSRDTLNVWNRRMAKHLVRTRALTLTANTPRLCPILDSVVGVPVGTSITIPVATDPIRPNTSDCTTKPAVDFRDHLNIVPGEMVVVTLCRLVPGKRVDLVLDVVDKARREDLAIRFVICGDGPELAPLAAEAERRNQQGWVHFMGHIGDPAPLLLQSDALLHPSDSEGLPFSLVESLLAGTPIVATHVGGVPDVLDNLADGVTVPRGDADALFDALCDVLERDLLQRDCRRAERARRAEDRYSFVASGEAHLALMCAAG